MSFIVKIILFESLLTLSLPLVEKTQYFVHLSFNSTFQLINGILNDLQNLLKYVNVTVIVVYFRILLAWVGLGWAAVFPNNLAFNEIIYIKGLKLLSLEISRFE